MGEDVKPACPIHSFEVSFEEARRIQCELRDLVEIHDDAPDIDEMNLVGGVDVAFVKLHGIPPGRREEVTGESGNTPGSSRRDSPERNFHVTALAVAVVLDRRSGRIVGTSHASAPVYFPYVPGFLSFREGPAVLKAIGKLAVLPDVIVYDACGIAHPRGLGLASHMGILTGIPSVGCAKSKLCGTCDEPGPEKGEWTAITYRNRVVGSCLRTRDNTRPVYVSPGTRMSIEGSRELVNELAVRYRLPEPTRWAHRYVTEFRRSVSPADAASFP